MNRTEYLETIQGQMNERFKRRLKMFHFSIEQEPKSKNSISNDEKREFRTEILRHLKELNRRAYRGDIVLEINFYSTQNNPPALHTLTKNYLDLLHKPLPGVDRHRNLLFKDDSQIKYLIANYHLDTFGHNKPRISIRSYPLTPFIQDIELTDRIINGKFNDVNSYNHSQFIHQLERDRTLPDITDSREDYEFLEQDSEKVINKYGQITYELLKDFHLRRIQENYLRRNEIDLNDLTLIFQTAFNKNKKQLDNPFYRELWEITKGYVFLSSDFMHLGNAPQKEGEKNAFKSNVQTQLKDFKEKHRLLFPLRQPISLTVAFIPPLRQVVDSDNLARYIVPFVTDILRPPATYKITVEGKYKELLSRENQLAQKFPPYSITGYQIIHIPRKDSDPENGQISLIITDGFLFKANAWNLVNDTIEKWERHLRF